MVQEMDQGSRDGWCKQWIKEQNKERWVVQAMNQGAIGGESDGVSGSGSNRRSDAMDQGAIGGAMSSARN